MDFEDDGIFVPDCEDEEFERKFIIAPCLTTRNKKWYEAMEQMSEESVLAFKEGRYKDVEENDKKWIPQTHSLYRSGARAIMGALTSYYNKEIHYMDFLDFGGPRFLVCKNVLPELEGLVSGGLSSHAFEGYRLIIQAQLQESRKEENEAKFKHHIQDWETLERDQPQVLKVKCHKKADAMSSEVHDLLAEMAAKKLHTQFDQRQRVQTGADMSFALTSAPDECGVHVGRDNHSHYRRQAVHNHRRQ